MLPLILLVALAMALRNFYRIRSFQGVFTGTYQQDTLGPDAGDGG